MKPTMRLLAIAVIVFLICWAWKARPQPDKFYVVSYRVPQDLVVTELLPTLFGLPEKPVEELSLGEILGAFETEGGLSFEGYSKLSFPRDSKNPSAPPSLNMRLYNTITNQRQMERLLRRAFPPDKYPNYQPVMRRSNLENFTWKTAHRQMSFSVSEVRRYEGMRFGMPHVRHETDVYLITGGDHNLYFAYPGPAWWLIYLLGLTLTVLCYLLRKPLRRTLRFQGKPQSSTSPTR